MDRRRILVVEDHPDSRGILVLALERWGYEVFEARDGREALAHMESVDFDLVVIDIALPFLAGRQVAESIKANIRTKHIPLLAVTALDTSENRKLCSEAGFDGFLAKPFSIAEFKRAVENLLKIEKPT